MKAADHRTDATVFLSKIVPRTIQLATVVSDSTMKRAANKTNLH